ncbi:disease resistance protein At4g27190 [Gossypium raimondii]|uniref:AAA+ ATPase domain-containing protein n=2 Tax=Gossypium raimondii TaxID=29730 RepID=A0A0D2VK60_GOSRA|nr:disease resistance protein At4g27190 [Gossypium raimondii]KJB83549.1 hypothetical protein B456_013G252900 [Gossypium raimondii]
MDEANIAWNLVRALIKPIKRETSFIILYKRKAANRDSKVRQLKFKWETVQSAVTLATRNGQEIIQVVKDWQDRARPIAEEPEKALGEEPKCFFGWFPNLKYRYEVSKKAEEDGLVIDKLLDEASGFKDKVAHPFDPQVRWATPSECYMAFESREAVVNQVLVALKDATLKVIGVYGVAGIGKTTLITQVAKMVKANKVFDWVALSSVTQTPDVETIQAEIADCLGLNFEEESVKGRATKLRHRLSKEKNVLVILDDIRTSLNLNDVGIVCGDHQHRGCKILLSSRDPNVLCEMNVDKSFKVDVLKEEEAWNLFDKMVGDRVKDPSERSKAHDVCRGCRGSPLSIVTTANALKKKDFSEWESASKQLTTHPSSAVELSFNHLANDELKSAFQLCSLMPYKPTIFDMLKYGTAFGLFQGITTVEGAIQRLHRLVQNLKSSCLLFDGRMAEEFAMHEVIREVAASIASREGKMFLMRNEIGQRELPNAGRLRNCTAISLFYNDFVILPDQLECPQLKVFQLYDNNPVLRISDQFFSKMEALEVLDVKGMKHLSSLPSSLSSLGDLQTLCLESCVLQHLAMVEKMKKLEILSFNNSIIEELPKEIGELTQLKVLNLDNCSKLRAIPPNVISNLSRLEELHIGNSFAQWEDEQTTQRHASLSELNHLPDLTSLNLHIPDYRNMPKRFFFKKLQRFKILIGNTWDWSDKHEASRILKLKLNESIHMNDGVQILLKRTEVLYLDDLKYVEDLLYDLDESTTGFPQLKYLHIQNGPGLKHIVNLTDKVTLDVFPVLESLYLHNLINLEKICNAQLEMQPFAKLRVINVGSCSQLKNLFSFSIARGLQQLQEVQVVDCKNMVEIITGGRGRDVGDNETTTTIEFEQLQSLTLQQLPKLISFNASSTTATLFNNKVTFPKLKSLKLSSISTLQIWQEQLLSVPNCIQSLTSITVEDCGNLKFLLSSSMVASLEQLIHLEISECKLVEAIIEETKMEERMEKILFPNLHSLKIKGLPQLTRFCSGKAVQFPSLKQLQIEHCPKLGTFISNFVKNEIRPLFDENVAFPSLEKMLISQLSSLKMLWNDQLPKNSFSELKTMEVEYCLQLQTIFPFNMVEKFQRLQTLVINDCVSLEEVFDFQRLNIKENKTEVAIPLKKLYLFNLPQLKHVWSKDPQERISFKNLTSVYVFGSESLKSLFPASVARGLQELESLEIDTCGVEQIVAMDVTPQPETRFVFPKLAFLQLWRLEKLRSFYPGVHSTEWPMLKRIVTYHYGDMKMFTSELLGTRQTRTVSQPLFLVEKVVQNLDELTLDSRDISMLSDENVFRPDLFSSIKVLQVHCYHQESAILPFGFIQNFTNLDNLNVGCCKFRELFPSERLVGDPRKPLGTLSGIRTLKLVLLSNLRHIWKPNSRPDLIPPYLESLVVWNCNRLISLAPPSSSFSNLTTLDIWKCHGVKHIISSSTAKTLTKLTKMSVRECDEVTEIVANDEDETLTDIVFSKLVCLELNKLPMLLYFDSGSYALKFPLLEVITLSQCPSLIEFHTRNELSTPKLKKVWQTEEMDQSCWEGDLNATVSEKMVLGTRRRDHGYRRKIDLT